MVERPRAQKVRHRFRLALVPGRPNVSLAGHLAIIDEICARPGLGRASRHPASVIEALKAI